MKRKSLSLAIAATFVLGAPALAGGDKHGQGPRAEHGVSKPVAQELSNEKVRQVQQALQSKGHDVGPIDGMYGPRTASALREFQRAQGMSPSGRMDHETLASLGVADGERTSDAGTAGMPSSASADSAGT